MISKDKTNKSQIFLHNKRILFETAKKQKRMHLLYLFDNAVKACGMFPEKGVLTYACKDRHLKIPETIRFISDVNSFVRLNGITFKNAHKFKP